MHFVQYKSIRVHFVDLKFKTKKSLVQINIIDLLINQGSAFAPNIDM